mmetsp:Transcript_18411/g.51895  ORF Transcript_18411/g.51895 Transcript_18411/m.51895 type:complete len:342 (+) Transcript_18411:634-1659(+)
MYESMRSGSAAFEPSDEKGKEFVEKPRGMVPFNSAEIALASSSSRSWPSGFGASGRLMMTSEHPTELCTMRLWISSHSYATASCLCSSTDAAKSFESSASATASKPCRAAKSLRPRAAVPTKPARASVSLISRSARSAAAAAAAAATDGRVGIDCAIRTRPSAGGGRREAGATAAEQPGAPLEDGQEPPTTAMVCSSTGSYGLGGACHSGAAACRRLASGACVTGAATIPEFGCRREQPVDVGLSGEPGRRQPPSGVATVEPKAEVASEAKLPGSGGTRWLFAMLNSGRGVPSSDEPSSSESRPGEASAPREGARDIARDARREAVAPCEAWREIGTGVGP